MTASEQASSSKKSSERPIVLAFSGGLDTSFCIPWLKETYQRPVVTVTVNCGGIDAAAARQLDERARSLGAADHRLIEARPEFFDKVLKFLIMGNVRRGHMYPLSVGAERGLQAKYLAELATELGSDTVAHGCTAAGNDQVRFEIVLKAVAPQLTILAPVRDHAWQRPAQVKFLEERKLPVPTRGSAYSTNRGLWGVTIGGTETLDSKGSIPESAWVLSAGALERPKAFSEIEIEFARGVPVALDGEKLDPVALIEKLETVGAAYGIGRGIHLGDTIIGTKGRVAFEAPAAELSDQFAPRAREAHAHAHPDAREGAPEPGVRPADPRGQAARSRVPRHRGAVPVVAGARDRQGPRAAAPRLDVRARRDVAALADGREPRKVRRGGRRMDACRRARFLEDHGAARYVPHPGRRELTCARCSSTRSRRSRSQPISAKRSA